MLDKQVCLFLTPMVYIAASRTGIVCGISLAIGSTAVSERTGNCTRIWYTYTNIKF